MTHAEAEQLLAETVEKLGEHFDAIQILATWTEQGASMCSKRGSGNFYARLGMVHEFISMNTADNIGHDIASRLSRNDE